MLCRTGSRSWMPSLSEGAEVRSRVEVCELSPAPAMAPAPYRSPVSRPRLESTPDAVRSRIADALTLLRRAAPKPGRGMRSWMPGSLRGEGGSQIVGEPCSRIAKASRALRAPLRKASVGMRSWIVGTTTSAARSTGLREGELSASEDGSSGNAITSRRGLSTSLMPSATPSGPTLVRSALAAITSDLASKQPISTSTTSCPASLPALSVAPTLLSGTPSSVARRRSSVASSKVVTMPSTMKEARSVGSFAATGVDGRTSAGPLRARRAGLLGVPARGTTACDESSASFLGNSFASSGFTYLVKKAAGFIESGNCSLGRLFHSPSIPRWDTCRYFHETSRVSRLSRTIMMTVTATGLD